jgi:ATP-binding cassette subfamily F protein uup
MVIISHDRRFLTNLSRATVWLDRGVMRRLDKGFEGFEAWRDDLFAEEETVRHKLDRKIVQELDWLRHGVSGRRKRNQRRLADLHGLRRERRESRRATGTVQMTRTDADMSAKLVIEAKNIAKSYGDRPIVKDFSIRILRGDRIGVVGANGTGKTTLLNLLTGAIAPDTGSIRRAEGLEMVALDQTRESLDPAATVQDVLTGGHGDQVMVGGVPRHVTGYMRDFLFTPAQARTNVGALSGGERARLMLARALAQPSNLLVLDEPTNDLDLETLDLLQEMLSDYPGTVLLVSHDRDFLDRIVTAVIAVEDAGVWTAYAGGYSDMVAQRGYGVLARAALAAPKPKPEKAPPLSQTVARRKLSFKEQRALETLPARIAALEGEIAALRRDLEAPELFGRDPVRFNEVATKLEALQAELAAAEESWLSAALAQEDLGR